MREEEIRRACCRSRLIRPESEEELETLATKTEEMKMAVAA
jgi:hypothetical protein